MNKELKIKCDCNSLMEFDYYANKFICPKCRKRLSLNEIKGREVISEQPLKISKVSINYQKDYFIKKIKKQLKKLLLIPKEFSKLKDVDEKDINSLEAYIVRYNATIALVDDGIYEIKDIILDNYLNLDSNIINLLYPLDFNCKYETIDSEVKEIMNNPINSIIYLKEEYEVFLCTIYDCQIKYNNKNYHIAMNSYNSKNCMEIPISKNKFLLITSLFLIVDIIYFIFSRVTNADKDFTTFITNIMFIMEFPILIILYISSKFNYHEEEAKNKIIVNKKTNFKK